MGVIAFFIKRGVVVRKSATDFTPTKGERLVVLEDTVAKEVISAIDGKTSLFDMPERFNYKDIPKDSIKLDYTTPSQKKAVFIELWGRVVYSDTDISSTEGTGFSVSILSEGELQVTFDEDFKSAESYGVFLSFETAGCSYSVKSHTVNSCVVVLKDLLQEHSITVATLSLLVKGVRGATQPIERVLLGSPS